MKHRCLYLLTMLISFALNTHAQVNWTSNNGPYYAAIDDYAVGLKNGQVVLYAADSSETSLMKSTDRGETWFHVLSIQGSAVQSVATARSNADIVYAGVRTGDVGNKGIWKSTNGGQTWTHLASQPSNPVVSRLTIHPTNPDIIWVGCMEVLPFTLRVLHRSTNGGASWQSFEIGSPVLNKVNISDIAIADTDHIWVSTYNNGALGNEGVWRTINGGQSWAQQNTGIDANNINIASLAIDPNNPDVLYTGNSKPASVPIKLYKTVNGRSECSWSQVNALTSGLYYYSDIRVSPHSSSIVYASTGPYFDGVGVLKSTDGGGSWSALSTGILEKKLRAVELDPLDASIVWTGGSGAHYKSVDAGASWQEKNIGMLFPTASALAKSGATVQSIGRGFFFRSQNGGGTWRVMFDELFMSAGQKKVAFDPNDPTYALATFGTDDGIIHIWRTTNKGDNWSLVAIYPTVPGTSNHSTIAYQGASSNVVYVAGFYQADGSYGFVLKSVNGGLTWQPVFNQFSLLFSAVAVNNGTVYAGGSSVSAAVVYKSIDAGTSWMQASTGLPSGSVTELSVDPMNNDIVYASTTVGVYKTTNGATNWNPVNQGIAYLNMASVLIHPINTSVVYTASNDGSNNAHFYRSTNNGAAWSEMSSGLPMRPVSDLAVDGTDPTTIFAATDSGAYHMAHRWTGDLAVNTTWHSGETYLVEGTLTVPAGKTLTIEPGAIVKSMLNAKIKVEGTLYAVGNSGSWITLTSHASDEQWQGIDAASGSSVTLSYVTIERTSIAINVGTQTALSMENCTITDAAIGVQIIPVAEQPEVTKSIVSCSLSDISFIGIYVRNFSDLTIQGTTVTGIGIRTGIGLQYSSAVLLNNTIEDFNVGLSCEAGSSPILQDGYNVIRNNHYGVVCNQGADPMLGLAQLTPGGMNSIYGNSDWDVLISGAGSTVWAEGNWWGTPKDPKAQFNIAQGSELYYDGWLDYDPNGDGMNLAGYSKSPGNDGGGIQGLLPPIVKQVLVARLNNRHSEAMTLLRSIIANASMPVEVKQWAVRQLLSVAQRISAPNLSPYVVNQLNGNPVFARELRGILPGSYIHERSLSSAMAAYDRNIQLYPNSELERDALYGKFLYALYHQGDLIESRRLRDNLESGYPNSTELMLAEIQLQNYNQNAMHPGSGTGLAKTSGGKSSQLPTEFNLSQNYPNPFNPTTTINYELPVDAHVILKVYDVLGKEVATLVDGFVQAGYHHAVLNAAALASGVYFYRIQAGSFVNTKKLVLLR